MPVIQSAYKPPFLLRNGHLSTILPSVYRSVKGVEYTRERITTPDEDFLDLDWIVGDSDRVVIIFHGLEGSSERHYVMGLAKMLGQHNL